MASWNLTCRDCKNVFHHSDIDDTSVMARWFGDPKPMFPVGGLEFECPNCGRKAVYERTDLIYLR